MHELRSRLVFSCLAAMLLAAQLVLTSAHLHLRLPGGVDHAAAIGAIPGANADHPPGEPGHDESRCPLCWAHLASGASLIPPVHALPLPAKLPGYPAAFRISALLPSTVAHGFQPRAPPRAAAA